MIDCYRDPSVLQFAAIRAIDAYNKLKKGKLAAATRTIFDRRNPTSLKAVWVGFTGWRIALSEKQISQVVENIENSCERWGLWNGWLCFEGRCSIQLSYGRVACIDSKSFIASWSIILRALTLYRMGRRSQTVQPSYHHPVTATSSTAPTPTLGPFSPIVFFRTDFQSPNTFISTRGPFRSICAKSNPWQIRVN
jgi:hypothetical protein